MKRSFIAIALLFLTTTARSQTETLVGQQAPPVVFQQNLGKPVKPDFYKGKVLVLDFWATWCAPCIANFPHYNELAKTYQNKDVVFGILSDEPLTTVKKFFDRTKKEVVGLNLTDTTRQTMNSYKVQFIPYCVVIGKDNVVKWMGQGQALTADILSTIIKGDALPASAPAVEMPKPVVAAAPATTERPVQPLFSFTVTPSKGGKFGGGAMNAGGDYISLSRTNAALGVIIGDVSEYTRNVRLVTNDTAKLNQLVDLKFSSKFDTTLFRKYKGRIIPGYPRRNMILEMLGDAMKFNTKVIKQQRKYYELVVTDSAKLHTFRSMQKTHSSFSDDNLPQFEIVGYTLKNMVTELQSTAKIIIKVDIKDNNWYDLALNIKDVPTLKKTLNFHGLDLKETTGEVELLEVTFY
ncbi:TlpA family protein disulfide reductase [Mucilaginibacter myungsuensis]|uniref:TlpA family protein disulfide reductase n=1 Tax=Mucilaginibacter myungsuensis TaxID=649104 RepID=A0A929KW95_9SPHI|nr:TlpA disulfide reductase family protein [Mucilaginibacter myungsuensis]MBE9661073.1 TlpA family protein disulfide reductase [Mucilaginibacter myungsuensis]MDN3597217.1 TlpA disulfide reductase family protein [Mucilaginibacter myungsuensis]